MLAVRVTVLVVRVPGLSVLQWRLLGLTGLRLLRLGRMSLEAMTLRTRLRMRLTVEMVVLSMTKMTVTMSFERCHLLIFHLQLSSTISMEE